MGVARVRNDGDIFVVEFRDVEYYALMNLLKNVSQYRGTSTGLVARSLLQNLLTHASHELMKYTRKYVPSYLKEMECFLDELDKILDEMKPKAKREKAKEYVLATRNRVGGIRMWLKDDFEKFGIEYYEPPGWWNLKKECDGE